MSGLGFTSCPFDPWPKTLVPTAPDAKLQACSGTSPPAPLPAPAAIPAARLALATATPAAPPGLALPPVFAAVVVLLRPPIVVPPALLGVPHALWRGSALTHCCRQSLVCGGLPDPVCGSCRTLREVCAGCEGGLFCWKRNGGQWKGGTTDHAQHAADLFALLYQAAFAGVVGRGSHLLVHCQSTRSLQHVHHTG